MRPEECVYNAEMQKEAVDVYHRRWRFMTKLIKQYLSKDEKENRTELRAQIADLAEDITFYHEELSRMLKKIAELSYAQFAENAKQIKQDDKVRRFEVVDGRLCEVSLAVAAEMHNMTPEELLAREASEYAEEQ